MGTSTEKAGPVRSSRRLAARVALVGGIVAIGIFALQPLIASAAQPTVNLGTAASYAVLAGQGVTNTGPTVIKGDLGTSPNPAVTGFPPGQVNGAIHTADAAALQAQSDLTTAYNDAAGRTPVSTIATELGGQTLTPGVYNSNSGTFQITGTLTLNAQGNPNGVFIFQTASTLVTATSSDVRLLGGAQPCTVFWQIGSTATLGTDSTFTGTIMALTSIQVLTNVTLDGRVLARNGSVALDADTITASACAAPSPSSSSSSSPPPSSQVSVVPSSGVQTGGGSTAGLQDAVLFLVGGALLVVAAGTFAIRRRSMHQDG
jgi:hypothetical protein